MMLCAHIIKKMDSWPQRYVKWDMKWEVCDRLVEGAVLCSKGEGRWSSLGKNNESIYEEGKRMTDSL